MENKKLVPKELIIYQYGDEYYINIIDFNTCDDITSTSIPDMNTLLFFVETFFKVVDNGQ